MRTIQFEPDAVILTEMTQETGHKELWQAIGYLSQWDITYPHVQIWANMRDGPELTAVYRAQADGPVGYAIGAVWHGDHFGFHS